MSRIRKSANLPPHLVARKYLGVGDVYGESKIYKRTQAPGIEYEAAVLYCAAGVKAVRVFMEDGSGWVCSVDLLVVAGTELRNEGRRILSLPRDQWTIIPAPTQSLF